MKMPKNKTAEEVLELTPAQAIRYAKRLHAFEYELSCPRCGGSDWDKAWVEQYNRVLKLLGERR